MTDRVQSMNEVLAAFRIRATCAKYTKVRNVSFYDVHLAPGARVRDLEKFSSEIALSLRAKTAPLVKQYPEEGLVRLQVVEDEPERIDFGRIEEMRMPKGILPFYLGDTIEGKPMWVDFHQNPHMLIAGTTGSGKSTLLHTIIQNAIRIGTVDLFLIDTKQIEFAKYEDEMDVKVDTSYAEAVESLSKIYFKMNETYDMLKNNSMPANYFSTTACQEPYTMVVIDEFADLIMQDDDGTIHDLICKIAQKGRAAGIHLTIATQRPSVDVFKGSMKANFPARIACRVSSRVDSQVILDTPGAEKLLGKGDALIKTNTCDMERFQCAYAAPEV